MKRLKTISVFLALVFMISLIPAAFAQTIWKKGDTGEEIIRIQERLKELNYLTGEVLGVFDDATEKAVIRFQSDHSLLETGMVDGVTWSVLFSENARSASARPGWEEELEVFEDGDLPMSANGAFSLSWNATAPAAAPEITSKSQMITTGFGTQSRPKRNTNEYTLIRENGFQSVSASPFSTFAADVDTASYAQLRSMILKGQAVPADAVRVEEMLNYFHYDYAQPEGDSPFGVNMDLASCPWNEETLLLQVGLQAKTVMPQDRPAHNLVFLIDVSGSMFGETRLDLVKKAFLLLLDVLEPTDIVSLVTYASRDEVVLSGIPAADKTRIAQAIEGLEAGGSTNSAAGITTAYQLAEKYAVPGGVNRIIMATDGDFNVGMTSEGDLARLVMEKKQGGTRLTMLGVGYGNYKDNKLEALADYGDGNYYYLDTVFEARRALVTEAGGTFVEVAKDVKLQIEFNPAKVSAYRLIGYEDRVMAAEDFADDSKDGGEIGSGHRVTALYEIVPVGSAFEVNGPVSHYQTNVSASSSDEWLTLNIRYKKPGAMESTLETWPLSGEPSQELKENMRFAAAVAETAMLLRNSEYSGSATYASALSLARSCPSVTGDAFKEEFVYLLTLLERK